MIATALRRWPYYRVDHMPSCPVHLSLVPWLAVPDNMGTLQLIWIVELSGFIDISGLAGPVHEGPQAAYSIRWQLANA